MAGNLPCPSWVWSSNSSIHTAKDRAWFGADYMPLNWIIGHIQVIGYGTVELPVKTSPDASGPDAQGILRLRNVLYVPSSICNVIGSPLLRKYDVYTDPDGEHTRGVITDKQARAVAYFDPAAQFYEVKLSGPPAGHRFGPSPFDPSTLHWVNMQWTDSRGGRREVSCGGGAGQLEGFLTTEEKQWLKKRWGGEFLF